MLLYSFPRVPLHLLTSRLCYILYYLNPSGLIPHPLSFLCSLLTVYQGPAVCWLENTVVDRIWCMAGLN